MENEVLPEVHSLNLDSRYPQIKECANKMMMVMMMRRRRRGRKKKGKKEEKREEEEEEEVFNWLLYFNCCAVTHCTTQIIMFILIFQTDTGHSPVL